ncbi:ISL3 family transposase [Carnobacteriaceae bacterium zg-84]|nr:ISL3 family transposase [Carnobacteriaceae bacterium zg-84]
MSNITEILLQLKDKNITFDHENISEYVIRHKKSLVLYGKLTYTPDCCPNCHATNGIVKNGTRQSRLSLCQISGLNAYLSLTKQRFYCKSCQSSFTAETPIVDKHCFITNRLKQKIMDTLTETISETYIAKQHNVSVHTVRRIVDKVASTLKVNHNTQLPQHLCFDEFKSVKSSDSAMSFIYCDALTHQLIDVVHDRKSSTLLDYFARYDTQTRKAVKTITIDMFRPYIQIAKQVFPNAHIIIDPFHIVQALNRELTKHRVHVMKALHQNNRRLYNKMKRYWKLFLSNTDTLSSYPYHRFPLFDWMTHTQGIVDYLLEQVPELRATYDVVHQLRDALHNRDFDRFEEILIWAKQEAISPGLRRVLRTFKGYLPYIKNTFIYHHLTNGALEGINHKIKVLKRNAYGYRNFSHFRNRILFMCKLYVPYTVPSTSLVA